MLYTNATKRPFLHSSTNKNKESQSNKKRHHWIQFRLQCPGKWLQYMAQLGKLNISGKGVIQLMPELRL